tara:strand:+ start:5888 stop:7633 length:1746 start_codon:yes stop_codon:yes gene_type:complete
MGLGYLTLATKSEQDKYLTGNPQFTFFKGVYKKHTNFATDYQYVNLIGDTHNSLGKKLYLDLPKNGDLLYRAYIAIKVEGNNNLSDVVPLAYSLIDYIDLFIGGQRIDRHYGSWLRIWHELNVTSEKQLALSDMVGIHSTSNSKLLHIPLRFWFNNNIGTSLPLLALQYNDVKIDIKFNNPDEVNIYSEYTDNNTSFTVQDTTFNISQVQVLCEYIHLDREERRLFMSNSHEYLITQVQTSLNNPVNLFNNLSADKFEKQIHKTDLRFNHPVKELVWSFQDSNGLVFRENSTIKNYKAKGVLGYNYWNGLKVGSDQLIGANLILNGKEMTEELPATFFRNIQNYQYHSGVNIKSIKDNNQSIERPHEGSKSYQNGTGIYSYSFSLAPEDYQPSGSLNFSNLEIAQLKFRLFRSAFNNINVRLATGDGTAEQNNLQNLAGYSQHVSQGWINIPSIDNRTPKTGDIILVKDQTNKSENGIYIYTEAIGDQSASSLIRHPQFNSSQLILRNNPIIINVSEGGTHSNKKFIMSIKETGELDQDEIHVDELNDSFFKLNSKKLTIYAVNYNILRIMSGMGSLLFSA